MTLLPTGYRSDDPYTSDQLDIPLALCYTGSTEEEVNIVLIWVVCLLIAAAFIYPWISIPLIVIFFIIGLASSSAKSKRAVTKPEAPAINDSKQAILAELEQQVAETKLRIKLAKLDKELDQITRPEDSE